MVRARLDDWVEVKAADAELLEVRELRLDPAQGPAVKIVRRVAVLSRTRLPAQRLVKAFVQLALLTEREMIGNPLFCRSVIGKGKTVRKDLVHHGVAEPFRRFEIRAVDRHAEASAFDPADLAEAAGLVRADVIIALRGFHTDGIPQRLRPIRDAEGDAVKAVALVLHGERDPAPVAEDAERRVLDPAAEQAERDAYRLAAAQRARRVAEFPAAAVMLDAEELLLRPAQQLRQPGGPRLEDAQRQLLLRGRQSGLAAVHHGRERRLEAEAAVVHQKAQQLRRGERL